MEKLNTWMLEWYVALQTIARDEEGQDFAEYALIFALVVVVAAAGFSGLATAIAARLGEVATTLTP